MRSALLLLSLLLAVPAKAQVTARLADLRLATAVRIALVTDPATRSLDVSVDARRGVVSLDGDLTGREAAVARVVRAVPGVVSLGGVDGAVPNATEILEEAPPDGPIREAPVSEAPGDGPVYHVIRRGETLFSLARRYDTTVDAILALNDRESTAIRVGERLRVR